MLFFRWRYSNLANIWYAFGFDKKLQIRVMFVFANGLKKRKNYDIIISVEKCSVCLRLAFKPI